MMMVRSEIEQGITKKIRATHDVVKKALLLIWRLIFHLENKKQKPQKSIGGVSGKQITQHISAFT